MAHTEEEIYTAVNNMKKYGGSFASSLGETIMQADPSNRKILVEAFPEYVEKYSKFNDLISNDGNK